LEPGARLTSFFRGGVSAEFVPPPPYPGRPHGSRPPLLKNPRRSVSCRQASPTPDRGPPMKDPWQSYLRLGVVHFMAFPECLAGEGPQLETLRAICQDGFFDAVDVGPMVDDAQRRECAALLRDCQMQITFACQ